MGKVVHRLHITITREHGPTRKAEIEGFGEPVYYGAVGGALATWIHPVTMATMAGSSVMMILDLVLGWWIRLPWMGPKLFSSKKHTEY